jgi:hypothetical protein
LGGLFGVSMAQASSDLQRYLDLNPGAFVYNLRQKRYEAAAEMKCVMTRPRLEEALGRFLGGEVRGVRVGWIEESEGSECVSVLRMPLREAGAVAPALPEPYRMVRVELAGLCLCGIYMPNLLKKVPYWEALIAALAAEAGGAAVALGDFNTCRAYVDEPGAIDVTARYMDGIEAIGFCDLWRQRYPEGREYSWYSTRGNGFRIDHAFLSPALAARARAIRYSHDERLAGLSDHSPLVLDVEI